MSLRYTKTEEEAIEVLNDSFMKVFKNINAYDPDKSFRSWFRRILINTAINHYHRHRKHHDHQSVDEHDYITTSEPDALSQLSYQDVIALIQQLSPAYQAVFNLYVIDGYSHEEIAKALNISVGSSKSNLSRARVRLQLMVKKSRVTAYKL